jgi:hypothetical protein
MMKHLKVFEQFVNEKENPPLEEWLYLIHHIHAEDDTNMEELHHCVVLDHLGNMFEVEHIKGEDGKTYHCITGVRTDQKIYWSEEDAKKDGNKIPCANRQLKNYPYCKNPQK